MCRGQFHQHAYAQLLQMQISKAHKDNQVISVFLRFWDLHAKKLLIKHWWNQPLFTKTKWCKIRLLNCIPKRFRCSWGSSRCGHTWWWGPRAWSRSRRWRRGRTRCMRTIGGRSWNYGTYFFSITKHFLGSFLTPFPMCDMWHIFSYQI